jgi:hypothetical protein
MINHAFVQEALKDFDLRKLFIEELGWDRPPTDIIVCQADGEEYSLVPVAQKRGMVVFQAAHPQIPLASTRQKVEQQVAKAAHEHIVVFMDDARSTQVWQWVRREPGTSAVSRHHVFHHASQSGDSLIQKLETLAFDISEEDDLTITTVASRVRQAFDVDKITKRFYERFQTEHDAFAAFVEGIQGQGDREWYTSLMLNRLMFVYFIQKKGFLDDDVNYLRNRLERTRADRIGTSFHSFYRYFLLRLFHEGLGADARTSDLSLLLGRVPYLNGGLFDIHELEQSALIEIADEAFERIFDFFDSYQWHLDERPLRSDNEINPDVLGYIFEKYINQKQMGAYYSKEDITSYICRNSIIPRILDQVQAQLPEVFDHDSPRSLWSMLPEDPDRYIFPSVRHGCDAGLPQDVAAGIDPPSAGARVTPGTPPATMDCRNGWNTAAPPTYALPAETWRDVAARRSTYQQARDALASGSVRSIAQLISLNLDHVQFAQDIVDRCDRPELLQAVWNAVRSITILDPTCGSGAFLFAALNILEPLYEACLEQMEMLAEGAEESSQVAVDLGFSEIVDESAKHPSRRYFILKNIILNNLFGVDIMKEAVEICKLRLFLKLAAQVSPDLHHANLGVEPLPDIDFNIKAGNTLVGFVSHAEVSSVLAGAFDFEDRVNVIESKAAELQAAFDRFREQQVSEAGSAAHQHKESLIGQLAELQNELDRYLADLYSVDAADPAAYQQWLGSHQPFHWFVEFFRIMRDGGFDVIIGNPPYVELAKVRGYKINGFETAGCGNLYCPMIERFTVLGSREFRLGVIVPLSLSCTERMDEMRKVLRRRVGECWISHFSGDANPSKLFEGVKFRLDIVLARGGGPFSLWSSGYQKWFADARPALFDLITYVPIPAELFFQGGFPKLGSTLALSVFKKLMTHRALGAAMSRYGGARIYVHRVITMFVKCLDFIPYFRNDVDGVKRSDDYKPYLFGRAGEAEVAAAALNSSTFFFYFIAIGDCFHCGRENVRQFPFNLREFESRVGPRMVEIGKRLQADLRDSAVRKRVSSAKTGVVEYDEFWPSKSKDILDEIDVCLAEVYGFTEEELDFIVNFDIKFRMGRAGSASAALPAAAGASRGSPAGNRAAGAGR